MIYVLNSSRNIIFSSVLLLISFAIGFFTSKYRKKKFKEEKTNILMILFHPIICLISFLVVQFNYDESKTFEIQTLQFFIMFVLLLHSAYCDIKEREVDDYVSIMLLIVGFMGFSISSVALALRPIVGAIICFAPLIVVVLFSKAAPIGGADIKIATACGLTLGASKGLFAMMFGFIFSIVGTLIVRKIKKSSDKSFPYVPYYLCGVIVSCLVPFSGYYLF